MDYSWVISESKEDLNVSSISNELGIPKILTEILVRRGINTIEKFKEFFHPNLSQFHDPFLMDGMELAVERILRAIDKKESVVIYGDYDVDGTNSIAMLYLFLKHMGLIAKTYVPDRLREGWGMNEPKLLKFKEEGINLIITVDCGITFVEQIAYAKSIGIDTVICDHHTPGSIIPDAVAVLNPLKENCKYPFKYLCACGVTYKLIEATAIKIGNPQLALQYLQFVAISTMADIVPIIDENRVMVHFGLEQVNHNPRIGILAIIQKSGLYGKKISSSQVVFIIAPRINAVGRLGDAARAVELLICEDLNIALELAEVLEQENKARSKIDKDIFLEAQELVEKILEVETDIPLILHESDWHPGVIGIVASRIAEKYCRPTIMMTTYNGVAIGSARSVNGFDVYEAMKKCEDKLIQFGGHKYAVGLAMDVDRLDEFRESFNEVARKVLANKDLKPQIQIDAILNLSELTPRFRDTLQRFSPYGPINMRPVFVSYHVEIVSLYKLGGNDKLKLKLKQDSVIIEAICFNLSEKLNQVMSKSRFIDAVYSVEENDKQNAEKNIQLKIRDFKVSSKIN